MVACVDINRIAVPETLLLSEVNSFSEMFFFLNIEALFVVIDAKLVLKAKESGTKL